VNLSVFEVLWQINFQIKPNKIILAGTVVSLRVNMRLFEVKFDENKLYMLVIAQSVEKKRISRNQIEKIGSVHARK